MILYNATARADIVQQFHERTGEKLNILISYNYLPGNAYKLTHTYRDMIDHLVLDSGAFAKHQGNAHHDLVDYRRFIERYGHLFDEVFGLDDNFDDPDHNFNNQVFLEEDAPGGGKRPIPVIHDREDPHEEFGTYVEQGHDYIAIGSDKRIPEKTMEAIQTDFPDVKIHMFGRLNRKLLETVKPYSADAATWMHQARFGSIYWWDQEEKKEHLIYVGERETKTKGVTFNQFEKKGPLKAFLSDTLGFAYDDLLNSFDALFIVNLCFFMQLERHINLSS